MKIAISIPEDLFRSAEKEAKHSGLSRSALFASAVAEYLAKRQQSDVTAQLNAVYANEPSNLDKDMRAAQRRRLRQQEW